MIINLPKLTDLTIENKKVLIRVDLDISGEPATDYRIQSLTATLDYLKQKNVKIIVCGHKGRPDGKVVESLSLKPLQPYFDKWEAEVLENLRFDPREEKNDESFAKELASQADFFVNEAFATSHRSHASIVGVPKFIPSAVGLHFEKEIENLSKVVQNPVRPLIFIISGIKRDKIKIIGKLEKNADKVLVGGRLPDYLGDNTKSVRSYVSEDKVIVGNLVMDKEDITQNTIEVFKNEIAKAKTIVLAGVLGKYENEGHMQGTKEIFEAVANSTAFKIAGGGDTILAIDTLAINHRFDWISVGGGAMLEFISLGTLPGIEALLK